jgi:hypothetical protein
MHTSPMRAVARNSHVHHHHMQLTLPRRCMCTIMNADPSPTANSCSISFYCRHSSLSAWSMHHCGSSTWGMHGCTRSLHLQKSCMHLKTCPCGCAAPAVHGGNDVLAANHMISMTCSVGLSVLHSVNQFTMGVGNLHGCDDT